jgi:hypothetical protein
VPCCVWRLQISASFLPGVSFAFVGCLTAGAIGAVVSVLSRMTFGELALDYEAGRRLLTMLGAFRPVIGMVFGAAMWVLSESNVLAIGPTDRDTQFLTAADGCLNGLTRQGVFRH